MRGMESQRAGCTTMFGKGCHVRSSVQYDVIKTNYCRLERLSRRHPATPIFRQDIKDIFIREAFD